METWRHIHGDIKQETEAQAIFLIWFTIGSSCKQKFVVCPFVDKESYQFANGLHGLNGLCPSMLGINRTPPPLHITVSTKY